MRVRLIKDGGAKPWAVIVEGPDGVQIEKRDFKTREAAEKSREQILTDLRA